MSRKLGEILLEKGYITDLQILQALKLQREGRERIGKILRSFGVLNDQQIEDILEFQEIKVKEGMNAQFGTIAVQQNFINDNQRLRAIEYQETSKGFIGDILVSLGFLTPEQHEEILRIQLGIRK